MELVRPFIAPAMVKIELVAAGELQEIQTAHGFRGWLTRYRTENSLHGNIRVRATREGIRAHLYCTAHAGCHHVTHFTPDALNAIMIVSAVGDHSGRDAAVRGVPRAVKRIADRAAREPPFRALMHLLLEGTSPGELPSLRAMRNARRAYLKRVRRAASGANP